jgi:hypothetical protein
VVLDLEAADEATRCRARGDRRSDSRVDVGPGDVRVNRRDRSAIGQRAGEPLAAPGERHWELFRRAADPGGRLAGNFGSFAGAGEAFAGHFGRLAGPGGGLAGLFP